MDGSFDEKMKSGVDIPDIDADLLDVLEFNEAISELKREIYSWAPRVSESLKNKLLLTASWSTGVCL